MLPETSILDRQGRRLFVLMVVVGYIVTFGFIAVQERSPTTTELL